MLEVEHPALWRLEPHRGGGIAFTQGRHLIHLAGESVIEVEAPLKNEG